MGDANADAPGKEATAIKNAIWLTFILYFWISKLSSL